MLNLALAVVVAELLVSADKPNAQVALLTILALVGGPLATFGCIYVAQAGLALLRQRNEARASLTTQRSEFDKAIERREQAYNEQDAKWREAFEDKSRQTEDLRGQLGQARNKGIALQLGTELRDIRHKIEMVRSVAPHPTYPPGFQLPAARWDEFDDVLATDSELYRIVESRVYGRAPRQTRLFVFVGLALRSRIRMTSPVA